MKTDFDRRRPENLFYSKAKEKTSPLSETYNFSDLLD